MADTNTETEQAVAIAIQGDIIRFLLVESLQRKSDPINASRDLRIAMINGLSAEKLIDMGADADAAETTAAIAEPAIDGYFDLVDNLLTTSVLVQTHTQGET